MAVFTAAGYEVRPAAVLDQAGQPVGAGHTVQIGRIEIVFRRLTPRDLLIVKVRRAAAAPGLDSPLQGIARFVSQLARTREETGLRRVLGIVNTAPYRADGGLDDARLGAFYQRLHGAARLEPSEIEGLDRLDREMAGKPGTVWVGLDLAQFRGMRPARGDALASAAPVGDTRP